VISHSFAFSARRRLSTLISMLELYHATTRTSPTPRRRTISSKYSSFRSGRALVSTLLFAFVYDHILLSPLYNSLNVPAQIANKMGRYMIISFFLLYTIG
jgi:hypothetical protein